MQHIVVGIEFTLTAQDSELYTRVVAEFKDKLHNAIRHENTPSLNWINDRCTGMDQIKGIKLSGGFET